MSTPGDDDRPFEEPKPDSGRHATARPTPTAPDEAPASPVPAPGGWSAPPPPSSTAAPSAAEPAAPAAAAGPAAPAESTATAAPAARVTTDTRPPGDRGTDERGVWSYGSAYTAAQPAGDTPRSHGPQPITPEPPLDEGRLFPPPSAPRSPSGGTHVLGVIVGLLLGPLAVAGVMVGQARILETQVDRWDATFDLPGILLVTTGLVLLACVLLLGLWTAAVPITAGALLSVLGGAALYAPGVTRTQVLRVLTTQGWHTEVTQVTVVGTSGTLIVAGFLLLLGGVVAGLARRHGVHLGEFRERNRA